MSEILSVLQNSGNKSSAKKCSLASETNYTPSKLSAKKCDSVDDLTSWTNKTTVLCFILLLLVNLSEGFLRWKNSKILYLIFIN